MHFMESLITGVDGREGRIRKYRIKKINKRKNVEGKKETMTKEAANNCRGRGELRSFFLSPEPENPFMPLQD